MASNSRRSASSGGSLHQAYELTNLVDGMYDYIQKDSGSWRPGKVSFEELGALPVAEILVMFLPEVIEIKPTVQRKLSDRFDIVNTFWQPLATKASGYFRCEEKADSNGKLETFTSQIQFLAKMSTTQSTAMPILIPKKPGSPYTWQVISFYSIWKPTGTTTILCFGSPKSVYDAVLASPNLQLNDPSSFHAFSIEMVLSFYDLAVWSWRHCIRELEKNRVDTQPDFIKMHEIARHVIHSSETIAMAIESMTSLMIEDKIFSDQNSSLPAHLKTNQIGRTLRSQMTLFKCLHLRSKALEERLKNEISLAFNMVAQRDSSAAMRIADATRIDSVAMKTISLLGLLFLPGTFICALFSTSFFDYSPATHSQPQAWTVSEKFWIYWAVSIPVTVVTITLWWLWQHTSLR